MTAPENEHSVASGWTAPEGLAEQMAAGAAIELLYVHVPFAEELEATEGHGARELVLEQVARTLRACLTDLECAYGVVGWPPDDLVAWVADSPDRPRRRLHSPEGLEIAVAMFLREALAGTSLPDATQRRLGELTVAREVLAYAPDRAPTTAYARALRRAQRSACDPVARALQRSVEAMDTALGKRAFCLHYQPIVDVVRGQVLAHEALCRGLMDGLRFPDQIFSTAERTHRVWELGRVLRDLMADALDESASPAGGATRAPLLFVNVHPKDIDDPVFLEQALSGGLARHASRVVVELTERAAISDYRRVKEFFATLRRHGYRLAIDDLGSGYAGLTSLAELEPDFIKFDMGLVRDLHLHPVKQRLIGRMHEFAMEIGAETISEGVETAKERDALLLAGCSVMQGYYFARPGPEFAEVPAERFPRNAPNPRPGRTPKASGQT